ncbi:MAG: ABC transporter substrate-binding protein [Chloroflexi bacterium]|nr:ABC transporter substrate-binding protein [Chloroflexota bacterium]
MRGQRLAAVLSGLVILGVLGACAAPASPPARPAATSAPAPDASTGAAAPVPTEGTPPRTELRTVKVGDLGILTTAALYVAIEKGYFREQGIETELVTIDGSARAIPLLATGELDAMAASATAGFFNAINQGIPMRVVADKALQVPGTGTVGLVVRQDLLDSGAVRTVADLRGRPVGINTRGAALEYQLYHILKSGGLSLDDVELVELALPDIMAALGTKRLDAAMFIEPFQTIAKRRGLASMFVPSTDVLPEYQSGVIVFSQRFPERDLQAARDWMVGYLKGIRAYEDARRKGIDREAIIDIMMKYTTVKDRGIYDEMVWASFEPNGRVVPASLAAEQEYYHQIGLVKEPVPMDRVIDEQFIRYAVDRLGPYPE